MNLPTLAIYRSASERTATQEQIVSEWLRGLSDVRDFKELSRRLAAFAAELRSAGYEVALLDEDGESFVVYGVRIPDSDAITIDSVWDEREGLSVDFLFSGPLGKTRIARSSGQATTS